MISKISRLVLKMFGTKEESGKQNLIKCLDLAKNIKMRGLLQDLIRKDIILTESVCKAMASVDRGEFTESKFAYQDMARAIDYGATISAPHMHAMALEYLTDYLQPGNKVLDVGSGSGYMVVAFSKMMEDKGTVVGIEHIGELYKKGIENISKSHSDLIKEGKIILKEGDGRKGFSEYAPYNCIHVGAAAESVPKDLVDQLAPGGRMMIPVGKYYQYIYLIDKDANGNITKDAVSSVRFVPLTDKEKQLANSDSNIFGLYL